MKAKYDQLNPYEYVVYAYVKEQVGSFGERAISYQTIAARTSIGITSVKKSIKGLLDKGLIVKEKRRGLSDAYSLAFAGDRILPRKGLMYMVMLDSVLKIGFSSDVKSRINSYRTGNHCVKLVFSGTKPITISDEKTFHKQHNNGSEKYSVDRQHELLLLLTAFDLEVA